ncbi:unnamed protein product [Closterium sp. NIES-64]|nr:unnamed protein product [Closterium sp. NIES-64]
MADPTDMTEFSDDLLGLILSHLRLPDLARCACVSRTFLRVFLDDPRLWQPACDRRWGHVTSLHTWLSPPHQSSQLPFDQQPHDQQHGKLTSFKSLYYVLDTWESLIGFWRGVGDGGLGSLVAFQWRDGYIEGVRVLPAAPVGPPANHRAVDDRRRRRYDDAHGDRHYDRHVDRLGQERSVSPYAVVRVPFLRVVPAPRDHFIPDIEYHTFRQGKAGYSQQMDASDVSCWLDADWPTHADKIMLSAGATNGSGTRGSHHRRRSYSREGGGSWVPAEAFPFSPQPCPLFTSPLSSALSSASPHTPSPAPSPSPSPSTSFPQQESPPPRRNLQFGSPSPSSPSPSSPFHSSPSPISPAPSVAAGQCDARPDEASMTRCESEQGEQGRAQGGREGEQDAEEGEQGEEQDGEQESVVQGRLKHGTQGTQGGQRKVQFQVDDLAPSGPYLVREAKASSRAGMAGRGKGKSRIAGGTADAADSDRLSSSLPNPSPAWSPSSSASLRSTSLHAPFELYQSLASRSAAAGASKAMRRQQRKERQRAAEIAEAGGVRSQLSVGNAAVEVVGERGAWGAEIGGGRGWGRGAEGRGGAGGGVGGGRGGRGKGEEEHLVRVMPNQLEPSPLCPLQGLWKVGGWAFEGRLKRYLGVCQHSSLDFILLTCTESGHLQCRRVAQYKQPPPHARAVTTTATRSSERRQRRRQARARAEGRAERSAGGSTGGRAEGRGGGSGERAAGEGAVRVDETAGGVSYEEGKERGARGGRERVEGGERRQGGGQGGGGGGGRVHVRVQAAPYSSGYSRPGKAGAIRWVADLSSFVSAPLPPKEQRLFDLKRPLFCPSQAIGETERRGGGETRERVASLSAFASSLSALPPLFWQSLLLSSALALSALSRLLSLPTAPSLLSPPLQAPPSQSQPPPAPVQPGMPQQRHEQQQQQQQPQQQQQQQQGVQKASTAAAAAGREGKAGGEHVSVAELQQVVGLVHALSRHVEKIQLHTRVTRRTLRDPMLQVHVEASRGDSTASTRLASRRESEEVQLLLLGVQDQSLRQFNLFLPALSFSNISLSRSPYPHQTSKLAEATAQQVQGLQDALVASRRESEEVQLLLLGVQDQSVRQFDLFSNSLRLLRSQQDALKAQQETLKSQQEVLRDEQERLKGERMGVWEQQDGSVRWEQVVEGMQQQLCAQQDELKAQQEVLLTQQEQVRAHLQQVRNQQEQLGAQQEEVGAEREQLQAEQEGIRSAQEGLLGAQEKLLSLLAAVQQRHEDQQGSSSSGGVSAPIDLASLQQMREQQQALAKEQEALVKEQERLNKEQEEVKREQERVGRKQREVEREQRRMEEYQRQLAGRLLAAVVAVEELRRERWVGGERRVAGVSGMGEGGDTGGDDSAADAGGDATGTAAGDAANGRAGGAAASPSSPSAPLEASPPAVDYWAE